jgi:CRP-like cAMP-binding protein
MSNKELTPAQQKLIEYKKKISFFKNMTQNAIVDITKNVRFIRYEEGEMVFEQGSFDQDIYLLISGSVELRIKDQKPGGSSKEVVIKLDKGRLFGEMSFITKEPRSATATIGSSGTLILVFNIVEFTGENSSSHIILYKNLVDHLVSNLKDCNARLLSS